MNKITIEIPARETISKTFDLPLYMKDNYGEYMKVISPEKMIRLIESDSCFISYGKVDVTIFSDKAYIPCTPEEFDTAFEIVMVKLNKLHTLTV